MESYYVYREDGGIVLYLTGSSRGNWYWSSNPRGLQVYESWHAAELDAKAHDEVVRKRIERNNDPDDYDRMNASVGVNVQS